MRSLVLNNKSVFYDPIYFMTGGILDVVTHTRSELPRLYQTYKQRGVLNIPF